MLEQICKLFLMFICYSMMGWAMEVISVGIHTKKIVNRGFLIGPYCPIYGSGCLTMILLLKEFKAHPIAIFVLAAVICSVLEYITSYIMEKMFKARWWDYSDRKFNLNGRVCLGNAAIFGILGTAMIYHINPVIESVIGLLSIKLMYIISGVILLLFVTDVSVSFNVMSSIKKLALEAKKDNTYEITNRVKELLIAKGGLSKRLANAYPNLISTIKSKKEEIDEKTQEFVQHVRQDIEKKKMEVKEQAKRFKISNK